MNIQFEERFDWKPSKLEEDELRNKVIEIWELGYSEQEISILLDMYIKDVYEIISYADISRN